MQILCRERMITVIAAVVLTGCAGGDHGEADSPARQLRGEVQLTFGEMEGEDPYVFSRIGGVAVDSGGRIAVADIGSGELRLFSPDGRFVYRIARSGSGPGEVSNPCCLAFGPDGALWVRDGGNRRYNGYTLANDEAAYRTAIGMMHTDQNRWAPVTFDTFGNLVDIGSRRDTTGMVLTRWHLGGNGDVAHIQAIPEPPADSLAMRAVPLPAGVTRFLWQPFGPLPLRAHGPDGTYAAAVGSRYRVSWFRHDGTLLHLLEGDDEGPELSEVERARGEEAIATDVERLGISRRELPYSVPSRKPVLRNLFFDLDGRLWVERSVPAGSDRVADVYARNGRLEAVAEWPARVDLTLAHIRGDEAVAVLRDTDDVERIVRLRFR